MLSAFQVEFKWKGWSGKKKVSQTQMVEALDILRNFTQLLNRWSKKKGDQHIEYNLINRKIGMIQRSVKRSKPSKSSKPINIVWYCFLQVLGIRFVTNKYSRFEGVIVCAWCLYSNSGIVKRSFFNQSFKTSFYGDFCDELCGIVKLLHTLYSRNTRRKWGTGYQVFVLL